MFLSKLRFNRNEGFERHSTSRMSDISIFDSNKPIKRLLLNKIIKHENFKSISFLCNFKHNNHVILSDCDSKCIHVLNAIDYNYIKCINLNNQLGKVQSICVIKHNNQLCVVNSTNNTIYVLNKDYKLVKTKKVYTVNQHKEHERQLTSLDYCYSNKRLYLLDKSFKSILVIDENVDVILNEYSIKDINDDRILKISHLNSMKVIHDKIYICNSFWPSDSYQSNLLIFDLELNLIQTIGNHALHNPIDIITFDYNNSNDFNSTDYIYIVDFYSTCIHIYQKMTLDYVNNLNVNLSPSNAIIFNNQMIVNHNFNEIIIYDIQV